MGQYSREPSMMQMMVLYFTQDRVLLCELLRALADSYRYEGEKASTEIDAGLPTAPNQVRVETCLRTFEALHEAWATIGRDLNTGEAK